MANINVTIKNLPEIRAAFNKAPRLMITELNTAIKKSLVIVEARSRAGTPVDTGRLRNSHRSIFQSLRGEVGTNTNYDIYVHDGTRYMKSRPYLLNAVNQSEQDIDRFFTKAVDNVLTEIGNST